MTQTTTTPELIRIARQDAGFTQQQLATALGVPQQRISEWERGAHEPRFNTVLRILTLTGRSLP